MGNSAYHFQRKRFLGIGRVTQTAKPIKKVKIDNVPLLELPLLCKNMGENSDYKGKSEYIVLVNWLVSVLREDAYWKSKSGLFTSQLVRASLDAQPLTVKYLEKQFDISFPELIA